jgi:polar amino acid transport system permease protein
VDEAIVEKRLRLTLVDAVVLGVLAAVSFWVVHKIRVDLRYNWHWEIIPQYLFRFDTGKGRWVPNLLMQGFLTTIKLSIWSTLLATIIGVVMALFRVSKRLFRRMVGRTYVELIRNMPPLVLVFIVYYFVSDQILNAFGVNTLLQSLRPGAQEFLAGCCAPISQLPVFVSAVAMLALYEGAYITEIVRAGITSIERGQWEASSALGFTKWQQMRHIIFPQATIRILPPLAGQLISTIKDSAIVSVISIQDLTFQGMEIMSSTYRTFEIWITITAMYFILTFTCSLAVRRLETAMQRK